MQKPYKFLNIPNHQQVSQEMLEFVYQHTDLINDRPQFWNPVEIKTILKHVPSLKNFLVHHKLLPTWMSVIIFDPTTMYTRIHADSLDAGVRLLWPVKNCAGSLTKFYDIPKHLLIEGTKTNWADPSKNHLGHYTNLEHGVYYPPLDCEWPEIGQVELTGPVVFDGSITHGVNPGPGQDFRITFTVGFDKNLSISKSIDAWTELIL